MFQVRGIREERLAADFLNALIAHVGCLGRERINVSSAHGGICSLC